jgi:hypothetical protein
MTTNEILAAARRKVLETTDEILSDTTATTLRQPILY